MLGPHQTALEQLPESRAVQQALSSLAGQMLATMDTSRKDRLWPADAMVFQTNPLNVAYGAWGTALFLYDVVGELPAAAREWLLAQPIDVADYPPGLYSGIAGIAWSLAEIGMIDRAIDTFRLVPQSPLAFRAVDVFSGAAGWGLASLALYLQTRQEWLRTLACQAGDHLAKTASRDGNGSCWPEETSGDVPIGFALGGSGIALFLLYLWRATGEPRYLTLAREAMDFEVAQGRVLGDALVWGVSVRSHGHQPYWLRGGGGVATALIRFAHLLGDGRYLDLARKAALPCAGFFSAAPHLFEGLASMGESLLDMFLVTGDQVYLDKAWQKALQTLLFTIERPQGIAFPGRYLFKISHDFGVGGAGIGLFLHRLVRLAPRRFHDIFPQQRQGGESPAARATSISA